MILVDYIAWWIVGYAGWIYFVTEIDNRDFDSFLDLLCGAMVAFLGLIIFVAILIFLLVKKINFSKFKIKSRSHRKQDRENALREMVK